MLLETPRRFLNESSALHVLRQRYGSSLVHTYAGPTMVAVNPMAPLQVYTDKVIGMFGECKVEEMPPHVFAVAAAAHTAMLRQGRDQSVIFLGRSGELPTNSYSQKRSWTPWKCCGQWFGAK